jgi:hypothetical protein
VSQFDKGPAGPDMTVDTATRQAVIDAALNRLKASYVFPETAEKMDQAIRARLAAHEYDSVTSAKALARRLTQDLQAVCHDKHLQLGYSPETVPLEAKSGRPTQEEIDKMRRHMARMNFGFEKVERLDGNVGYLDLRAFAPAALAGETAASAMTFLASTDALIIDLRQNGGGAPDMVAMLSSYLFPVGKSVHLNDLYSRPDNSTHQWWTQAFVPGTRYGDKPVFVLTSKRTFSAAEEFTYNLKCLKRATIVGATTGGGAHPGGVKRIHDHFTLWLPEGRAINPITKTNWEGTGVKPDVEVPATLALATAHLSALDKLCDKSPSGPEREQLKEARAKVRRQLESLNAKESKPDRPG